MFRRITGFQNILESSRSLLSVWSDQQRQELHTLYSLEMDDGELINRKGLSQYAHYLHNTNKFMT